MLRRTVTTLQVLFERLHKLGYTGGISILKEYVHPLRPAVAGHAPVQRYETKPGEQVQFDWGEFVYEHEGKMHKFYGFTAILGYSRMRFVTFVKRCDTPTLIRCLMEAFEYFGGLTKVALTDRMKSVLLEMEENKPRWNPRFADFMVSIGVAARVCKPYTPQTNALAAYCPPCVRLGCLLIFVSIFLRSVFIGWFKDRDPMIVGPIHGKQTCPSPVHEG
jgi:transposase